MYDADKIRNTPRMKLSLSVSLANLAPFMYRSMTAFFLENFAFIFSFSYPNFDFTVPDRFFIR